MNMGRKLDGDKQRSSRKYSSKAAFYSLARSMVEEADKNRGQLSHPMRSLVAAGCMLCDVVDSGPRRDYSKG